jgi:hypothetical protein
LTAAADLAGVAVGVEAGEVGGHGCHLGGDGGVEGSVALEDVGG